jgi:hypothetical protein
MKCLVTWEPLLFGAVARGAGGAAMKNVGSWHVLSQPQMEGAMHHGGVFGD